MIELNAVGKRYRIAPGPGRQARTVEAVRNITASLETGIITAVVGPNGAGKTTLFGLLLGFLEPTDGTITIDGRDARAHVRRHGASYLPERFTLPRDWTVRAALEGLFALDGSPRPVDDVLTQFELDPFAAAAAHTLSRGTLQRVGIAQALAAPRELVVLDEPTEGLDALWRVRFRELVQQLRAPGRVVLIASHDLNEIERVADRALVLRDGSIAEDVALRAPHGGAREYALTLQQPHAELSSFFPRNRATGTASYSIVVDDAADLSSRLAALIDAGGVVVSVVPATDLEQRVTGEAL